MAAVQHFVGLVEWRRGARGLVFFRIDNCWIVRRVACPMSLVDVVDNTR